MMTWNYSRSDNFDGNIKPFAKSGYDFFVCPGVSDWNRILPDFDCATTNIYYFVRDGLKYGAIGMLNTEWKDDCETLNATMVHGVAWGAECAWGGSATSADTFNRRIGAVLFGERGDHFGKAVELLGRTYGIKGVANGSGIPTSRFYANDFSPALGLDATRKAAQELLGFVRPAIVHLEACRQEAVVNAGLLDGFILGARRMELIGLRMMDAADALEAYIRAYEGEAGQAHAALAQLSAAIRKNGELRQSMFARFAELWARENKPYALSRVEQRYAAARQTDEAVLAKLGAAEKAVASGKGLPSLARLGLGTEGVSRHTWPDHEVEAPMMPAVAWMEPTATHRLGLGVRAGPAARQTLPIEQDLALPQHLRAQPVRAFCSIEGGAWQEIPVQLDPVGKTPRTRLTLVIQETIPAKGAANIYVYFGLAEKPKDVPQAVRVSDARAGMKVLENDRVRVWLGSEGGHLYRWEVKALEGRDLTQPGETGWSGFSDIIGELRAAQAKLTCLGSGPAVVRFSCAYPSGETKQISLFAGASWTEEMLSGVEGGYTDYDDPQNFAADGPMPGHYLFSGGENGPVGKHADGRAAQVYVPAIWSIKFNDRKMALGLVTPEGKTSQLIGPGGGWGGVGVNGKPPAHVVTFAGMLEVEPDVTMKRLQQTLDLKNQPGCTLFGWEQRKKTD